MFGRIPILILCALLVGAVRTSQALLPRPVVSTNTLTGIVSTNYSFGRLGLQARNWRANRPCGVEARLYLLWWELKDDVCYGVPYLDPPAIMVSSVGLMALIGITLRSFRRGRNMPTRNDPGMK